MSRHEQRDIGENRQQQAAEGEADEAVFLPRDDSHRIGIFHILREEIAAIARFGRGEKRLTVLVPGAQKSDVDVSARRGRTTRIADKIEKTSDTASNAERTAPRGPDSA